MKKSVAYLLALLAFVVSYGFDDAIIRFAVKLRVDWLTSLLKLFTYFGDAIWVVIIILGVFLWLGGKREYIMPMIYGFLIAFIFVFMLKMLVARPRPYEVMALAALIAPISSSSFPSLHAGTAFSMLPVLVKAVSKFRILWIILISLIALSRVYLGVHYLSDVIMGAIIGYAVTDFFVMVMNDRWFRRINFLAKWTR